MPFLRSMPFFRRVLLTLLTNGSKIITIKIKERSLFYGKKNLDWSNLGFGYMPTDARYVSNFKDGKWDDGALTSDPNITMNECAGRTSIFPVRI